MAIGRVADLKEDHILDDVGIFFDPWTEAIRYVKGGQCPPFALVRQLGTPSRVTGEHRLVVRAARRTARAVERLARGEVQKVHELKEEIRRLTQIIEPRQLRLPLEVGLGIKAERGSQGEPEEE